MKGSLGRRDRALRITGGAQLQGDICVSGSKNAALPEMAAALLTTEPVRLKKTVGRMATYLQAYGDLLVRTNGWDAAVTSVCRLGPSSWLSCRSRAAAGSAGGQRTSSCLPACSSATPTSSSC